MKPSTTSNPDDVAAAAAPRVVAANGATDDGLLAEQAVALAPVTTDEREGPGSLADRIRQPQTLISFAIAVAIIVFFVFQSDIDLRAVWRNARDANLALYALAFVAFYATFPLRALRWRLMLAQAGIDKAHGYHIPKLPGMLEIFLLSWFANCVVPAKLGDAYRSYLFKRRSGSSFSTPLGTILAERLTDLTVLFVMMSIFGVIAFHGEMPEQATTPLLLGLGLLVIAAVGLAVMWFSRHALERRLPERFRAQYGRLHDGLFACLRRPQLFAAISIVMWACEGLRLYLVTLALDAHISISTAVFVALMASLLTTIPVTPAGLGVVEAGMIVVLKLVDVESSMAGSVALLDRVIGYWSIILVGLILYIRRMRKEIA